MSNAVIYRMTISSEDILGTLEALSTVSPAHMPTGARSLQKKFQLQAAKINIGAATPAYVTTGHTRKQELTVESLGGSREDEADHTLRSLATIPVATSSAGNKPSENLNESEEEELARLEREMLAELSAQGNENVITEERRKVPRTTSLEPNTNISISDL